MIMLPNRLVDALNNGQCVVFIGSGLSSRVFTKIGKRYPNWTGLLSLLSNYELDQDIITYEEKLMIDDIISKGNLTLSAQILRDNINESDFTSFLESIFRNDNRFDFIHGKILELPFAFLVTTNYDSIIENAYSYKYNETLSAYSVNLLSNVNKAISENKYFLFKAHGTYEQPRTITLTTEDYWRLQYSTSYNDTLKNIFINYSVLFVGYSYNDPDIQSIIASLSYNSNSNSRMHYLLSPEGTYNSLEKECLKKKERLTVIDYDNSKGDHSGIDLFFAELGKNVKKNNK